MNTSTQESKAGLWVALGGIFLLTFIVYYSSLWNPFVRWDDGLLIYENPAIHAITPATLKAIFTSYDPELYIPLTFFTYQVNYAIGMTNPVVYHLTNLLLHIANALLVCWFLLLMGTKRWIAVLCGFLFAVHPLHTEAVAWASARKDVLSTCFFLLSLNCFLTFKELRRKRWYWFALSAFVLALLSKVVAAMLPGVLLLIAWKKREHLSKNFLMQMVPFVVLSLVFIVIAFIGKEAVLADATYFQMGLMATKSTMFYMQKLILPTGLSVLYPFSEDITISAFIFPVSGTLILLSLMLYSLNKRKWLELGLGLSFFFLTLLPTFSNFAKGGDFYFASDRYAYLPSVGILLVLAYSIELLSKKNENYSSTPILQYSSIPFAIIVGVFSWMSYTQAAVWSSSEALFQNAVEHYPNAHVAHNNIGNMHYRQNELEEALAAYYKALQIRDHHRTRSNLAAVLRKQGKIDESLQEYQRVLASNPESKEAYFGLGLLAAQQGQYEQAIASYTRALELDPSYAEVNINFGALYMQLGDTEKALEQYDRALYILPFSAQAHYNRAIALKKVKRTKDAITAYEKAVHLEPSFVAARINLGILYHERRKIDEAVEQFEMVLRYDPKNSRAQSALQQLR